MKENSKAFILPLKYIYVFVALITIISFIMEAASPKGTTAEIVGTNGLAMSIQYFVILSVSYIFGVIYILGIDPTINIHKTALLTSIPVFAVAGLIYFIKDNKKPSVYNKVLSRSAVVFGLVNCIGLLFLLAVRTTD